MKIYQYPNCSTCKKAMKFLNENEIAFEPVDITEKPPSVADLKAMIQAKGIKKLFNTSGQVYRQMKLSERVADLSEKEAIDLLKNNGKLIKRPFVVDGELALIGFKQDEWAEAIL